MPEQDDPTYGSEHSPHDLREADESIPAAFERTVAAHPLRTALVSGTWQPRYLELNAAANRLARDILAHSRLPGDRVAILMEHDTPAVAALVAVLKAGRIVVALNRNDPPAWLRELIADSEASLIVADANLCALAKDIAGPNCAVVSFDVRSNQGSDQNLSIVVPPEQVAIIVYTSGSTGRPKGVMVTHRQMVRNVVINTEAVGYCPDDRVPLFGSLSGIAPNTWAWCTLLNGAALCPYSVAERGFASLNDWVGTVGITVFASQASVFRHFMKTLDHEILLTQVRAVRLGGESVTSDDFKMFQTHFSEQCVFVVAFSSSETCNIAWSRRRQRDRVPEGRLPIGPLSKGQTILLLDEEKRPVPPGEVGEIVVRSRYVAAGYWRNPALTAERFSDDLDGHGTRVVRTGDLGRINAEGFLEFCGRRDDRLKIRGNRIELGEIAGAVQRLPGIEQALVEALDRTNQEPQLVCYVVAASGHSWTPGKLRRALWVILPSYMVPSSFVLLDTFPLTPSGKIDRERLRRDFRQRPDVRPDQTAWTETETLLGDVWAELFHLPNVTRDDDFFDLGGDSLMAAVAGAEIHAACGVELNLKMFAEHPTLGALARFIDQHRHEVKTDAVPLVQVSRGEPLPLSFAQERMWFASQDPVGLQSHIHAARYRLLGQLDIELLRDCLNDLIQRHEMLRTTFPAEQGRPMQVVHAHRPVDIPFFDVAGTADAESQAELILQHQAERPLDLGRLPLIHFSLVRVGENEYWLQRVLHHILTDPWSSQILFRELAQLYAARRLEVPQPPLPPLTLQYADYAAWERNALRPDGRKYQEAMKWWMGRLGTTAPALRLPCLRSLSPPALRPGGIRQQPTPADGFFTWGLDADISQRLAEIGRAEGATYFVLRLAAFVALLGSETGQRDILLGTYATLRNRLELHSTYGLFINLVALRFEYRPDITFREWIAIVQSEVMEAESRSVIPFDSICTELERNGCSRPPVEVIFNVQQTPRETDFADLKIVRVEPREKAMPWGFTISPNQQAEQQDCWMNFDANIYDPVAVRALIDRYKSLLDRVSRDPDRILGIV